MQLNSRSFTRHAHACQQPQQRGPVPLPPSSAAVAPRQLVIRRAEQTAQAPSPVSSNGNSSAAVRTSSPSSPPDKVSAELDEQQEAALQAVETDPCLGYDLEGTDWGRSSLSVVVLGASGDLAKKKIFPALFALYYEGLLPEDFQVFGYARSKMSDTEFREMIESTLTCRIDARERCQDAQSKFLKRCFYQAGPYDTPEGFQALSSRLDELESHKPQANRMFFLSIPPNVFLPATGNAADYARSKLIVLFIGGLKAHSDSNMGSLGPSMLLAFDFDHTIVDGNTDTHVIKASPSGRISDELKSSYQPGRWTEYMQRIFDHLHAEGVSVADMQRVLQQLPYTQGMEQLLQELQGGSIAGQPCSCIILSDSNSQFIDWILCSRQHRDIFSHVYTNPASISTQGQLHVTPHHNHACGACPVNMCKREILQMHHQSLTAGRSEPSGLRVAYVGDGGNDLCPAQSLGAEDVVFARAGYALDKMLQEPAVKDTVKAHVHVWSSAAEIVNVLRRL